jgi:hypothetical protein
MDSAAHIASKSEPKMRTGLSAGPAKNEARTRIEGNQPFVDIHAAVPLYFTRYFIRIQIGRDRRKTVRRIERQRRQGLRTLGNVLFFLFVLSPVFLLLLAGLYLLKMALGIDLFPFHLPNLLGLGR